MQPSHCQPSPHQPAARPLARTRGHAVAAQAAAHDGQRQRAPAPAQALQPRHRRRVVRAQGGVHRGVHRVQQEQRLDAIVSQARQRAAAGQGGAAGEGEGCSDCLASRQETARAGRPGPPAA